jgi:hypothetical protein
MTTCPICQQPLPEPAEPRCPSCGAGLTPERGGPPPLDVRVDPGGGWAGAPAGPGIPWQDRDRLGFITALVETTRGVLTAPGEFFARLPASGGMGSAILYGVIVGWLGLIAAAFYQALFNTLVGPRALPFAERTNLGPLLTFTEGWGSFLIQAVFGGVFVVIGMFIAAGIFHLLLLLLGGARRDFEATLQVVAYSHATSLLALLPFCGGLIGGVWALVLCILGLARVHQIGHGKAAAAVLLPVVLCCCCLAGLVSVAVMGMAGALSQLR